MRGSLAIAAAREALAPLRELHIDDGLGFCSTCDSQDWPCDSAKLIYTSAELAGGPILAPHNESETP